nr:retrovirus-related Pol polyprotein from transposon TNT 1-94 [Tanacetum cinerariifolium]
MSNTNNNLQTQTSNTFDNAIMEADSKDRAPMLAPGIQIHQSPRGIFINQAKTLVDLPKDKWAIITKWVFRNKNNEKGILIKNKARLVAQRHTQEEGIDYDEVFAPVARIKAIRLFLAYASFKDFVVYQMDFNSAFLYGKIEKEVYVCQPPGSKDPDFPNKVYKVEKALYRLHQAPRAWYETLSTYLMDNGFHRGQIDKTLFIKRHKDDILLVQVYVDDIIFRSTKKVLIQQKSDGIFYSQDKYVADILKNFGFSTVKTASTPMEPNYTLVKDIEAEDAFGILNIHHLTWKPNLIVIMLEQALTGNPQQKVVDFLAKDETVYKEWEDIIERAAIIASSLEAEQDSGNINKTQCMATLNEPLPQGTGSGSGPWCQTTAKVKKVNDQEHIQDLVDKQKVIITKESIRCDLKFDDAEAKEIAKLKKRVKKLEQRKKSRSAGLRRLNKGKNIKDIDLDAEIALVDEFQGRMQDTDMFRVDDLEGNEVFVENSVEDSTALTTATTVDVDDELTLEKTLISIKAAKPKVIPTTITTPRAKGIVFHEQVQAHKPASLSKDKGKAKMIEPKKPLKKKDQITLDEEVARKLEAEMRAEMEEEEERIAREKDKENRYVIKEWDDVQATIDADRQLAKQI